MSADHGMESDAAGSFSDDQDEQAVQEDETINTQQVILNGPSASYIKRLRPGDLNSPLTWRKTKEHAEIFMRIQYHDYLEACG